MGKELSFTELDQLATDHLQDMLDRGKLTDENRKLIAYEIRIRNMKPTLSQSFWQNQQAPV